MLKTYDVWVNISTLYHYRVPAETREFAIEMAKENAKVDVQDNYNVTYDVVDAEAMHE